MNRGEEIITCRLRIFGRVQGVGYRDWTIQHARRLGLTGWVRNLSDGTVEGVVQGARASVEIMIAACHAGPPLARVTQVDSVDHATAETFATFQQRATAAPE